MLEVAHEFDTTAVDKFAFTLALVQQPSAGIDIASGRPLHFALTVAKSIDELAYVHVTIWPLHDTLAMALVVAPLSFVGATVRPSHQALAMARVQLPLAFVLSAIWVSQLTPTVAQIVLILTLVDVSIRPFLDPQALLLP